jgi:hypothetical protein
MHVGYSESTGCVKYYVKNIPNHSFFIHSLGPPSRTNYVDGS